MKLVINRCFGGFGLSDAAYERLIELGVPVKKYVEEKRGKDGLFIRPEVEEKSIYDRELTAEGEDKMNDYYWTNKKEGGKSRFLGARYWEVWLQNEKERSNPLLIQVVEELGEKANGPCAELKVVEIPDGTNFEIDEYDGIETVHEIHQSWS